MPVPEQTPVATFTGNGVTTDFSFAWGASATAHVVVEVDEVELVQGVDYTVLSIGDGGGTVRITPAPVLDAAISIFRRTPLERVDIDYQEAGPFLAETVDLDFNTIWRAAQEIGYSLSLVPQLAVGSPLAGTVRFPPPGAGLFLRWNAAGTNLEAVNIEAEAGLTTIRADLADEANPLNGVALVRGAARVVDSIAELRALPKAGSIRVMASGYYAPGDGGGGLYWLDASDTSSADNGGTIIVATDGGRWKYVDTGYVTSRTFGAKGDRVTDDTARAQAHIDWCLSFPRARPMIVSGQVRLTTSLIIDRPVDSTTNEFRIIADGTDSGFYADAAIEMFDSSIDMPGADPVSEAITFENIRFEASADAGVNAHVLTEKFLRLKFLNCYFERIRLLASTTYIQSMFFDHCNIRYWPGTWLVATHAFDTHFVGCQSEFGSGFLTNFAQGSYSLTFTDGLHEGSSGGLVSGGGFRQLKADGMYFEGNATPNFQLDAGLTNHSVSIKNSFFSAQSANAVNPSFWDIVWGPTLNAEGGGNCHDNGRLHDNGNLAAGGLLRGAAGDAASVSAIKSPKYADGGKGDFTFASTLGSGTPNYARFTRKENLLRVEFSFTFAGTSGSAAALFDLPLPAADAMISGIVTYSDYSGDLRIVGGTGFLISDSATRIAMASDNAGTGVSYTSLNGKTVVGEITYRV